MKYTILHNISRDASFGLNQVFDRNDRHYEARSHELVKVFEFEASDLIDPDVELPPAAFADVVFRAFNVGHEPGYYQDEREHALAVKYRARRLRSLSVGDVLICEGGHILACDSIGWFAVDDSDLRVLTSAQAGRVIRDRYRFKPGEQLTITVPLEGCADGPGSAGPQEGNGEKAETTEES